MKFPSDTTVLVAQGLLLLICNHHSRNNQEYQTRSKKSHLFIYIGTEKETLQIIFNLGRGVIINMQSSTKLSDSLGPKVSLHFLHSIFLIVFIHACLPFSKYKPTIVICLRNLPLLRFFFHKLLS